MKKFLNPVRSEWPQLCRRPAMDTAEIEAIALPIFEDVQRNGDQALKRYTQQYDKVNLDKIQVDSAMLNSSAELVSEELKNAITFAYSNIYQFHLAQRTKKLEVETVPGVHCWQEKRPIEKVGLYIPGGTAPLFSSILMLAIPAKIAGCKEIMLCTPPDKDGKIDPVILYTAHLCGIDKVFKLGGIQAIAAMTFGTESLPAVYKIFGPGNQYVTVAKQMATRFNVAIDMPAGPSELLVLADAEADPEFVAADLLSQAEHGTDSQVILVSTSEKIMEEVETEIENQLKALPRKTIAEKSIENSKLIYFPDKDLVVDFINEYGPEHYIICSEDEEFYLNSVQNAGSVFAGKFTPESAGDYASGTNHTLPTHGYAKQYSGVNLDSFLKSITFQKISENGLQNIGRSVELMAEAEGLIGHKNAVSIRLKKINRPNEN
ncbi:MAG: histidinol dehydrogenase [Flavobacteriaceae bacterium]